MSVRLVLRRVGYAIPKRPPQSSIRLNARSAPGLMNDRGSCCAVGAAIGRL